METEYIKGGNITMPKISIIVPVYNVEYYLDKCIESILTQTYSDFELILVDDGSTDNSGKLCDEYTKRDNRVKVVHKDNGGLSSARNAGIDAAIGDYLGFVDGDDWIASDMYESLLSACLKFDSNIAMCSRYRVDENKTSEYNKCQYLCSWSNEEAIEKLLTRSFIDHSSCDKLFKKELFLNIRFPEGKYYEDMFVMVKLLYKANKIINIGESKYYYCYRPNSITSESFSVKKIDYYYACTDISDFVTSKFPRLRTKARRVYYEGLITCLVMMQPSNIRSRYLNEYNSLFDVFKREYFEIIKDNEIKTSDILELPDIGE